MHAKYGHDTAGGCTSICSKANDMLQHMFRQGDSKSHLEAGMARPTTGHAFLKSGAASQLAQQALKRAASHVQQANVSDRLLLRGSADMMCISHHAKRCCLTATTLQ